MQNQNIYSLYRLPSRIFFGIFMLCMCAWASRFIRISPSVFSGEFMWLRAAEWPVWIEHFAATLGLPSLFLSVGYWASTNPATSQWKERTPVIAFLMPIFLAFVAVVLLVYGEAGHELDQILLTKPSNYGQYIAGHCLPAGTIHALSLCASTYKWTVYSQGLANVAGTLTFLALFATSTWRIAQAHMARWLPGCSDTPAQRCHCCPPAR
jgi:hypothetical protein